MKTYIVCLLLLLPAILQAQKAGAIHYDVTFDWESLLANNPEIQVSGDQPKLIKSEMILRYSSDSVHTRYGENQKTIPAVRPLQYAVDEPEFHLLTRGGMVMGAAKQNGNMITLDATTGFEPTGRSKEILGYACEEYLLNEQWRDGVKEYRIWVTEELGKNVSPVSNAMINGTVLEASRKDGQVHFVASEVSFGNAEANRQYKLNQPKGLNDLQGEPFPEFSISEASGKVWDNASIEGEVTVLNFWFTQCKPCIQELPMLNQLVQEFSDEKVNFLAPTFNETGEVEKFLKRFEFDYKVTPEANNLIDAFALRIYPVHVVIGPTGLTELVVMGFADDTEVKIRDTIKRLLVP